MKPTANPTTDISVRRTDLIANQNKSSVFKSSRPVSPFVGPTAFWRGQVIIIVLAVLLFPALSYATFTDNGDGTITDNSTGLAWSQDANPGGAWAWDAAITYVAELNSSSYLGYNDWYLPSKDELSGLITGGTGPSLASWLSGQGFTNVQSYYYWSSTGYAYNTGSAWFVSMDNGFVGVSYKTSSDYVWPVRAGSGGPFDNSGISVSPASHDFGNVVVGATSTAQTFTLSNIGNADLVIGTISITGTDAAAFSIQNDSCSGQTVAASGSCTVEAVFSTTVEAAASANLSIPSNGPDTPTFDVTLSGTGGVVDTVAPSVIITFPEDGSTPDRVLAISGTASPSPSSGLDRVDIQVLEGTGFYLRTDDKWDDTSEQWITNVGASSWSHSTRNVVWVDGETYTVTAKAFDVAGNSSVKSIEFIFNPVSKAYTTLSLIPSSQTILQNNTISVTGKLTQPGGVTTNLSGQTIKLTITAPDTTIAIQTTTTYSSLGNYEFPEVFGFIQKGPYTVQTAFNETSALAGSASRPLTVHVGTYAGYAIIVEGKISSEEGLASHNKTTNRIYKKLLERGFVDDNIYYFNYDNSQTGITVDEIPSKSGIQDAIEGTNRWFLDSRMNSVSAPLYIIMLDHGGVDTFYINNESITPGEIALWLDTLESKLNSTALLERRVIIYGACYSGSFIDELSMAPTGTDGGRVIITSAAANEESYKGPQEPDDVRSGSYFLEDLFKQLGRGKSLKDSFVAATETTEIYTRRGGGTANSNNIYFDSSVQHPLLDDDGDGVGSNVLSDTTGDGQTAKNIYLGTGVNYNTNSSANLAEVTKVTNTLYLGPSTSSADLWARSNDDSQIDSAVWMEIRKPSDTLSSSSGTNQLETPFSTKIFMKLDQSITLWERAYSSFTGSGMYEIFYYVQDIETKELSPSKSSVVYKNKAGNNAPGPFNLKLPENNDEQTAMTAFEWGAGSDPDSDAVTYNLLISTDSGSGFDNNIVYRKEEITSLFTIVDYDSVLEVDNDNDGILDTGLSDLTTYYWKVQAVDAYGSVTDSNETWSFYTDNTNYGFGYITGIVYDARSFAPIVGATVKTDFGDKDATKTEGYYIMSANEGTYTVTCSLDGYFDTSFSGTSVSDGKTTELNIPMTSSVTITPDIKANGSSNTVTIGTSDTLSITISLDAGNSSGVKCDWWVAESAPDGWYYFDAMTMSWLYAGGSYTALSATYQGALFDLNTYSVLNTPRLSEGTHTFYFAIDTNKDGNLDLGQIFSDSVIVNVQ